MPEVVSANILEINIKFVCDFIKGSLFSSLLQLLYLALGEYLHFNGSQQY